jgi:hypothetical protein
MIKDFWKKRSSKSKDISIFIFRLQVHVWWKTGDCLVSSKLLLPMWKHSSCFIIQRLWHTWGQIIPCCSRARESYSSTHNYTIFPIEQLYRFLLPTRDSILEIPANRQMKIDFFHVWPNANEFHDHFGDFWRKLMFLFHFNVYLLMFHALENLYSIPTMCRKWLVQLSIGTLLDILLYVVDIL